MHIPFKSLLPKNGADRDALNSPFSKIKPRFIPKIFADLWRLKILLLLALIGYFPNFAPDMKPATVLAQEPVSEIQSEIISQPIRLPHPGYLSAKFSKYHQGIDIATGLGMPVRAILDGSVESTTFSFWGYGNHVIISHQNGLKSLYAHMGRIYVTQGQEVTQDSIMGEVGMTGFTSGPHTHLEITKYGNYIDPQTLLPEIPKYPKPEYLRPVGGNKIQLNLNLRKTLKPDFN